MADELFPVDEVETRIGRALTDTEMTAAEDVFIPLITAELSTYLNRPVMPETYTETVEVSNGRAFFRHTPIISIDEVTNTDSDTIYDGAAYDSSSWGISGTWSTGTQLTATYTAGLSGVALDACKNVVLNRVARAVIRLHDDAVGAQSMTVEGYTASYEPEEFTDKELKAVERWRRRVVRT